LIPNRPLGIFLQLFSQSSHVSRYAVFFLLFGLPAITAAQGQFTHPPKREVRAVWLATAAGLDWPKTTNRTEQQTTLRNIVRYLHAANFNTIFFQVRARGDAYYRSHYEPWAENLTGTLGNDPGWDPLKFLLDEAHAEGIEIHAWFNVFKVRGPNPVGASSPLHISRMHPSWTVPAEGEVWLDPGIPEVRQYLLNVALDLVSQYDLDGINFDFIRYPGRTFPDDETFRRYGNGATRDDWRRGNITALVADFYARAIAQKPKLKIGSSPLGVYEPDAASGAAGSPTSVYQESESWLERGFQDYLSPQIYWDIGASRGDPDFAGLVERWQEGSGGRHIYAGIGAYKPEVLRELGRQIDVSRGAGNQGQAFFRYDNLQTLTVMENRYSTPALIPPMLWKDSIPPVPPTNLAVGEVVTNVFHLEWSPSAIARDGDRSDRYVIYRGSPLAPCIDSAANIVAIVPASTTSLLDTVRVPTGLTYYYTVTALDRTNNESAPSTIATGVVKELLALKGKLSNFTTLATSFQQGTARPILLGYRLARRAPATLEITQRGAGGKDSTIAILASGIQEQGSHVVGMGALQLPPGRYMVHLRTEGTTLEQPLTVSR